MTQSDKYQHCMVMAGGGFHFGYYLGMYAAMCELGRVPDVILASCGGAIAAAIVQRLPDHEQRKAWLCSRRMYRFWSEVKLNPNMGLTTIFAGALQRRLFGNNAKYIPDLFNNYLFEIPVPLPLPEPVPNPAAPDVVMVAGKLLYSENDVGQRRHGCKLFSEVLFGNERIAELIGDLSSPLSVDDNAIAPQIIIDTTMPVADAVRASVSDMFYFRCYPYGGNNYVGGVLDLFPIEVATRLASRVTMERKGFYDTTYELPALRAVFGFDGNQRLRQVLKRHADVWVDTSDMEDYFLTQSIRKKIIWRENKIAIIAPPTYETYVQMIEAQWQYGCRRARESLGSATSVD